MRKNDNIKLKQEVGRITLDMVGDLTPISLNEARKAMGDSAKDMSDESVLTAILDFTAIARAHIRNVPKYNVTEYNKTYRKVLI